MRTLSRLLATIVRYLREPGGTSPPAPASAPPTQPPPPGILSIDPGTVTVSVGEIRRGKLDGTRLMILRIHCGREEPLLWCLSTDVATHLERAVELFLDGEDFIPANWEGE